MTARDDAIARVTRLGAVTKAPVITAGDVGAIVDTYPLVDVNGVAPSGAGWVPTYDTNAALAEVWSQKAALVAGDYNFKADDAAYDKASVLTHMLAMEAKYRAMVVDRAGRSTQGASTLTVGGTNSGLTNPLDDLAAQVIP